MLRSGIQKLGSAWKKDIVLTVSLCLAVLSCVISPPSKEYLSYIDFHTLILLFCLMLIIEGLRERQFFRYVGDKILAKVKTTRGICFTLVFLCFCSSMLITNDVALITFVPFGILILEMTGMTAGLCLIVTLMTIAANLGSMFTPIGNPQNLYLYSLSGLSMGKFLVMMFPYMAVAGVILAVCVIVRCPRNELNFQMEQTELTDRRQIGFYAVLFLLCVLTVAGVLPHLALLVIVAVSVFLQEKKLFARADYGLLLTFVFFFVFVGNMQHVEGLNELILSALKGRERIFSVAVSQVISNVPAAMLLSGYTDNVRELIIGTNIGGLGTLIASMASLISYKQIANRYPQQRRRYIGTFTFYNIVFLILLYILL